MKHVLWQNLNNVSSRCSICHTYVWISSQLYSTVFVFAVYAGTAVRFTLIPMNVGVAQLRCLSSRNALSRAYRSIHTTTAVSCQTLMQNKRQSLAMLTQNDGICSSRVNSIFLECVCSIMDFSLLRKDVFNSIAVNSWQHKRCSWPCGLWSCIRQILIDTIQGLLLIYKK